MDFRKHRKELLKDKAVRAEYEKLRRVKIKRIVIKDLQSMLDDFVKTGEAIERGGKLKTVRGAKVYFTSFEAVRRVLTPKRLELLHVIKMKKPSSINELARMATRDVKNVMDDVRYLEQVC